MKHGKFVLAALLGLALGAGALAQRTFITIGSGSTTGLYFPTAVGIAKIINDADIGVRANGRSTGGSVFNAGAIQSGELQMTLIQNDIAFYCYTGTVVEACKNNPATKLRGIATLYPEPVHILARADSGIRSVADFKGKRVYVGDVGSGVEQNAKQILEAYGLTFDDLGQQVRGRAGQAVQLLQDGRLDAMFYTVGIGSAAIQQAALTTDIEVLALDLDTINKLKEQYPFYAQVIIPGGVYQGIDVSVPTVTVKATLAASADLPEDVVYRITKLLFQEKLEEFYNIQNPNLREFFTLEKALDGMPIPLHPGAVRFYQEVGIPVPERLLPPEE
ncbi:TAXI family TRAP transporter solute-binding subunit [Marinithermus hydrothermalis]|uniref:TRAP transporter solute receptor, TAXI family n=1 Tax=Marinithermus hydrothermalis (strain DSM 14884 / JCM 11576 / T1) TaxID=869210 RepID=F2NQ48_MARHT|nr:TAXI family TRAP transporter solute-binding subunit [Marinithermus hydrothermalis]AEB11359.1 TRAP transporter solute receptor, TAXI family [Marinithermus hydrothermalis DSM 14884]